MVILLGAILFFRRNQVNLLSDTEKRKIHEFDSLNIAFEKAKSDMDSAARQLEEKQAIIDSHGGKIEALKEEITKTRISQAEIETQKKELEKRIKEQQEFIAEAQKTMKEQFENIANKQLQDHAEKFSKSSSKNLGDILEPLAKNIENFKKEFSDTYNKEARERFALEKEIKRIVDESGKMVSTTENLTRALKGNRKLQGNFGEMILEKFLEDSGLKKDDHYKTQSNFINEEGKRQLPDVTIYLPEGRHIIVDSKISLVAYERYFSEESDEIRVSHARDFIDSVKAHIKGLAAKNYQDNKNFNTLDFVIMFMPIEGTFQLASEYAPDIFSYGWSNKVVVTSPATLFPILKTISSIWKVEDQNKNTRNIIKTAEQLYNKFINFARTIEDMGKYIEKTDEAYRASLSQLKDGKGNLVSIVRRLENFGIDKKGANKKLPEFMRDDFSEENETEGSAIAEESATAL